MSTNFEVLGRLKGHFRIKKGFALTKRQKFVVASFILALGIFTVSFLPFELKYQSIGAITLLALVWTLWTLWEDLAGVKYLIIPILPLYYTISFSLFSFLLPEHFLARALASAGFGISFYFLVLTQNIFNISTARTIQLIRAAHTVGFFFSLLSAFFIFNVILSFRLPHYFLAPLVFGASFPVILQSLWSFELEDILSRRVAFYSGVYALILAEVSWVFAFWPTISAMGALVLVVVLYFLLGVIHAYFDKRLTRRTLYEYLGVWMIVFVIVVLTTRWGGG